MTVDLDDLKFELQMTRLCAPPFEKSLSALRQRFCGATFDLEQIKAAGFRVHPYGQCNYYIRIKELPTCRMEQRLFFSPKGVLRNIRFFRISTKYVRTLHVGLTDNQDVVELLEQSLVSPIPQSAEDEWMILAEVNIPENERKQATPEKIWDAWMQGLNSYCNVSNLETAARFITGALRFPDHCRNGELLARAAWGAVDCLHMDAEALELCKQAVQRMLEEDQAPPLGLKRIADTCYALGQLQPAVMAQYLLCNADPDDEKEVATLWDRGEELLRDSLRDGVFRDVPPLIDLLFDCRVGIDDKRQASALAALGMIYESGGDLSEARDYYDRALQLDGRQTMAAAGQHRINDPDKQRREAAFEDQRWCYPFVRREVGSVTLPPCRFLKDVFCGDMWASLVPDMSDEDFKVTAHLVGRDGKLSEQMKFLSPHRVFENYEEAASLVYQETGGPINITMLLGKLPGDETREVNSFFPVARGAEECVLPVVELEEWETCLTGVVRSVFGETKISFFDPLYAFRKTEYQFGVGYAFSLSGFLCSVQKAEDREWDITEGPLVEMEREKGQAVDSVKVYMKADHPMLTGLFGEDTTHALQGYTLPVHAVKRTTFIGEPIVQIETTLAENDNGETIPAMLYAHLNMFSDYFPEPGDYIEGTLCLQGFCKDATPQKENPHPGKTPEALCLDIPSWMKCEFYDGWGDSLHQRQIETALPKDASCKTLARCCSYDPGYGIEQKGRQPAFVFALNVDLDERIWEECLEDWKNPVEGWCSMTAQEPVFFVGIGTRKCGTGRAFEYFGYDAIEEYYRDLRNLADGREKF